MTISVFERKTIKLYQISTRALKRLAHKKTKSKKQELSAAKFQEVYSREYGELWPSIYEGLKLKPQRCAVLNKYAAEQKETRSFLKAIGASKFELEHSFGGRTRGSLECYHLLQSSSFPPPVKTSNGLLAYYLMDAASILPVLTLGVGLSSAVLDMCAAPGGKSILIAQLLSGNGVLVSNEPVYTRRDKLLRVINQYIGPNPRPGFQLTAIYGEKFGSIQPSTYDRVLLDVPCSGDRHSLHNEFSFQSWSEKRSKLNAKKQAKLLLSALETLQPGGHIVYSTCTMTSLENDKVISYVIDAPLKLTTEKTENKILTVDRPELSPVITDHFNIHETKFGFLIFPSLSRNWGPIYFCRLTRTQ